MNRARRWLKRLGAVAAALVAVVLVAGLLSTSGCATFGAAAEGARLERMKQSPLYSDGAFHNEEPTELGLKKGTTWSTMRDFFLGTDTMTSPICELPLYGDTAKHLATPPASGLRITWLGHSTTLIEIDGKRILTDPQWSDRASPSTLVGPQRFHPPPLPFEELPQVDAVLISHDHYDHLDMKTVQALAKRGAEFHVALGVGAHLEKWGVAPAKIIEHQWWQEADLGGGVRVISTPSRHFSGRSLNNRNSTLWTSWSLIGPAHRVFFSGDTGMTKAFDTIREKLGPFDLSMLEIGQWNEAWGEIHLGPAGAAKAHQMLGAKRLIPIHWATFELGLHDWNEPPETLLRLAKDQGFTVLTPMLGEPIEPTTDPVTSAWWRAYPPAVPSCPAGSEKPRKLDQTPL